jgi:hypothetical protein
VTNPDYTPGDAPRVPRSSTDAIPQSLDGVGETSTPAIGAHVRHRLSGAEGLVVGVHNDPYVKDLTHGIVEWTGDGDGFGQGYSNTSLTKF